MDIHSVFIDAHNTLLYHITLMINSSFMNCGGSRSMGWAYGLVKCTLVLCLPPACVQLLYVYGYFAADKYLSVLILLVVIGLDEPS